MLAYGLPYKPFYEAPKIHFLYLLGVSLAAQEIQTVVFLLKRKEDRM